MFPTTIDPDAIIYEIPEPFFVDNKLEPVIVRGNGDITMFVYVSNHLWF